MQQSRVARLALLSLSVLLVSGITRCQASEFLIFFLTAAIYWHVRGQYRLAGFGLAAAILLKVFPATMLAYFLWRRQWRVLCWTGVTLLLLGLLLPVSVWGLENTVQTYERWAVTVAVPALQQAPGRNRATPVYTQLLDTAKPRNQSLEALYYSYPLSAPSYRGWTLLTGALMLVAMISLAGGRMLRQDEELRLCCAFLVWTVLVPPVSESHYFGLLILPLVVLFAAFEPAADGINPRWRYPAAALMLLATILGCFDAMAVFRPLGVVTLLLWLVLMGLSLGRASQPTLAERHPHGF